MRFRGAGGTDGGVVTFLVGLGMAFAGLYLLLQGIIVQQNFHFGRAAFHIRNYPVPTGMLFIPFLLGIGMIFFNSRNWIGWILAIGSIAAMVFGVLASLNIRLVAMTAFDLVLILVLLVGGIGLFLRSLRDGSR
ncbi:MAG: hypothetical protein AAGH38_09920, partial [Pseudomonadota bacterium]